MYSVYHLEGPTAVSKWCRDLHVIEMQPFPERSTVTEWHCTTFGALGSMEWTKEHPAEARGKFKLEEVAVSFLSSPAGLTNSQFLQNV